MQRQGEEVHLKTNEARAGSTNHVVRYVLAFGLGLAILALSAIWITGALNAPQGERNAAVSNQATPQS